MLFRSPVVPTVSVKVNGVAVELPEIPVRSTNENGIVDVTPYEVTYKLPAATTAVPAVTASASHPDVKIAITQAPSATGAAMVKCEYKGLAKIYKVQFAAE